MNHDSRLIKTSVNLHLSRHAVARLGHVCPYGRRHDVEMRVYPVLKRGADAASMSGSLHKFRGLARVGATQVYSGFGSVDIHFEALEVEVARGLLGCIGCNLIDT